MLLKLTEAIFNAYDVLQEKQDIILDTSNVLISKSNKSVIDRVSNKKFNLTRFQIHNITRIYVLETIDEIWDMIQQNKKDT